MPEITTDAQSLPAQKQSAVEFILRRKEAGQPVILSIEGEASFVIQDPTSYQQLLDLVDRLETIEALREGIASIDRGEGQPASEFIEEMRQKYNTISIRHSARQPLRPDELDDESDDV